MKNTLRTTIQQILLVGSTAAFAAGAFAAAGQQNPPPGPGQIPDYFGVTPNYATSPQPIMAIVSGGSGTGAAATTYDYSIDAPTKSIMDIQGGKNYKVNDVLTITAGAPAGTLGATCIATVNHVVNGSILPNLDTTGAVISSGVIIDPVCTGIFTTPVAGSGIRKFVDSLATLNSTNNLGHQLPVAVPDTTTFPGSDYYEIAETEYTHQFHSDLPATNLRGYKQLNVDITLHPEHAQNQYLGPIIVAQKGRPVRVKLVNQLSTGAAGKLPIPVDTTYMGADGANDTDNRTALHLHGGNTPWISDGTPRQWVKPAGETAGPNKGESARNVPDMWFDASGVLINDTSCVQGTTTCGVSGATNNPGDGSLTFFYTNEQSARLMFYHDHAEGTTRLNVYDGMAAGYVLQDPTEQSLVYDAINNPTGVLPPLADTIPLVIQEKTFVPDKTQPVLNFYGPFASQLQSQDPTWRWGTTNAAPALNGNGDLWVPHVFMPNQNPGDVSGANAVGRWDYGPWFWPPFTQIVNSGIKNPYYDPSCNTTVSYCENQFIPGVPNGSLINVSSNGVSGGVLDKTTGKVTESPSGTPEAFNDTAMVNGTAYPYISVDPKKYRLRMLSVGNDRMLNLSLVVAASKNSVDTTAAGNAGTANSTILCDGTTNVAQADCTEVKMVPFNDAQNIAKPFPGHWYTRQKGGVTFDGRPSGVFDPATRGPEMVQIGTEGGFLSSPVEIKNQPVNYEYNPKNILIGNVKEKALFLGPAERADVLVDFSNFAGATLILYNDAPAPNPAWDLRLDYYTGNFDNTDTGGAFSVVPGYGPNSRTLMQIRVSTNGGTNTHPVDDLGNIDLPALTTAVQTAFKTSQEPIIVPQSVYSATYGMAFADALGADLSRISDNWLTYSPLSLPDANGDFTLLPPVKLELEPKSIIEDWTQNWGRMNALLGTEVPHTSATLQTSIPQAFVDPPTDLVKITPNDNMVPISGTAPDGTQLWKITHNGVDSHAIHFHLFHVQIVNRVGWDGAIYAPDANELGWKDTVRMNPLSDTIVALRPMTMKALPFKVPNSHRLLNPALAVNATSADFFNLDPISGNASTVTNQSVNYGWEYLWHCHILGHEENDMMRTIAVAQPPEAPSALTLTPLGAGGMKLDWTDNSIISNWVKIQRSTSPVFATIDATFDVVQAECDSQAGCVRTYTDTTAKGGLVYYRIMANNTVGGGDGQLDAPRNPDGSYGGILPASLSSLTPGFTGYANVTGNSNWTTASGEFPKTPAFNAFLFPTPPVTVSMTWTASSVNPAQPDSYQVRRTAAGNANLNCATAAYTNLGVATTALTATDTTIAVNRSYCYKVVATNAVGSFTSAPVKITPPAAPAAPTILTITNATPTGLTLGWQETVNLPVPTGFEIQRCSGLTASGNCGAAGAGWTSLGTVAAVNGLGSYSYNVTGLISGTPYLFRVRAFDPVTSAFVTSAAVAYPVAIVNTATVIANTTAAQNISAGNVLTNDLPSGPAASKTVTNLTGAIHTGGSLPVTVGAVTVTPLPATATVTCTTAGVCSLTLTSPAANTVTGNPNGITNAQQTTLNNQLRQASKRGTYTFDYTETYTTNYGTFTSAPVTVTVTVN